MQTRGGLQLVSHVIHTNKSNSQSTSIACAPQRVPFVPNLFMTLYISWGACLAFQFVFCLPRSLQIG